MNSNWNRSVLAWLQKELRCELRSKHGVFSSALFGFMAVVTAVFATSQQTFPPDLAAGFLCVVLVFAAVVTVPRVFLVEEDQRTLDLARLIADPSVVYTGKTLFCSLLSAVGGIALSTVFVVMTRTEVPRWDVLLTGSLLFALSLTQVLALCSTLVVGAKNRWVLVGVIALPLILPLVFCGVGTLRFGFGQGAWGMALRNLVVLVGYGVGTAALGPVLTDAVWGKRKDPATQDSRIPQ